VYFSSTDSSELNKGMMIDLTPMKNHMKVATTSKERPQRIPLTSLKDSPQLPLTNKTFVISGNILERNEKEKLTTDKLTTLIKKLGGNVFTGDLEREQLMLHLW
jgi:hypothetical protein